MELGTLMFPSGWFVVTLAGPLAGHPSPGFTQPFVQLAYDWDKIQTDIPVRLSCT